MLLYEETGKDFRPNVIQPFLENIDKGSRNDGSWKFTNPNETADPLLRRRLLPWITL